jgi:hypothetical protein
MKKMSGYDTVDVRLRCNIFFKTLTLMKTNEKIYELHNLQKSGAGDGLRYAGAGGGGAGNE